MIVRDQSEEVGVCHGEVDAPVPMLELESVLGPKINQETEQNIAYCKHNCGHKGNRRDIGLHEGACTKSSNRRKKSTRTTERHFETLCDADENTEGPIPTTKRKKKKKSKGKRKGKAKKGTPMSKHTLDIVSDLSPHRLRAAMSGPPLRGSGSLLLRRNRTGSEEEAELELLREEAEARYNSRSSSRSSSRSNSSRSHNIGRKGWSADKALKEKTAEDDGTGETEEGGLHIDTMSAFEAHALSLAQEWVKEQWQRRNFAMRQTQKQQALQTGNGSEEEEEEGKASNATSRDGTVGAAGTVIGTAGGTSAEVWVEEVDDESGDPYYYNRVTGKVTWKDPRDMNHANTRRKKEYVYQAAGIKTRKRWRDQVCSIPTNCQKILGPCLLRA
jgi:hypothetical protein